MPPYEEIHVKRPSRPIIVMEPPTPPFHAPSSPDAPQGMWYAYNVSTRTDNGHRLMLFNNAVVQIGLEMLHSAYVHLHSTGVWHLNIGYDVPFTTEYDEVAPNGYHDPFAWLPANFVHDLSVMLNGSMIARLPGIRTDIPRNNRKYLYTRIEVDTLPAVVTIELTGADFKLPLDSIRLLRITKE